MTGDTTIPAAEDSASPQEISGVFRGSADGATALQDAGTKTRPGKQTEPGKKTEQGISARAIPTFVAGEELADLADSDARIVVLTADLAGAGRTIDFADRHPDRFFNIGVAEQNMVSIAAGMASTGLRPFVSTFAAYLALLCCEQVRTDLAYTGMPVVMLAHHSGMTLGYYGTSHHALEDLSAMRGIAGLTVVCASDANELRAILRAALEHDGPVYVRMGRGRDPEVYADVPENFAFGTAIRLTEGEDIALIATGSQVRPCLQAAEELANHGISVTRRRHAHGLARRRRGDSGRRRRHRDDPHRRGAQRHRRPRRGGRRGDRRVRQAGHASSATASPTCTSLSARPPPSTPTTSSTPRASRTAQGICCSRRGEASDDGTSSRRSRGTVLPGIGTRACASGRTRSFPAGCTAT